MTQRLAFITVALTLACFHRSEAHVKETRKLLQAPSSTSVAAPAGTTVLQQTHGIGTQNYTAQPDSTYKNTGAVAALYTDPTTQAARHFFDSNSVATFVFFNPSTGQQMGLVHGKPIAQATAPPQADDGGFGSVNSLLLQAFGGEGTLEQCTYIQRLNTLGGVAPKGLFTLPAWNGIANAQLAVPYQADYIFLAGGSSFTGVGGR